MTDKEKFRKEVEKLKSNLIYGACSSQIAMETMCKEEAYNEVLAILDTMQEEPVSEELEEAALMHFKDVMEYEAKHGLKMANITSFKAGAKWQNEQMMAKAINAQCFGFQGAALFSFRLPASNYLVGSKVKVIVIKED